MRKGAKMQYDLIEKVEIPKDLFDIINYWNCWKWWDLNKLCHESYNIEPKWSQHWRNFYL